MQIAIDTSTDIASIALILDREIIAEFTWHCGQNHTVELYPRLDFLLKNSGLDISTADHIFVAKGPGSFNGLRVGVSAAKGLAFSLGIPIIGISTLEISAYSQAAAGIPVCAIQNAGREEIAAAIYQRKRSKWQQLKEEHITTVDSLSPEIKEKTIFCGEIKPEVELRLKKIFKTKAVIPGPAGRLRRAAYLAELGIGRAEAGLADNLATLQPLYLRRPPITQPRKAF